jgi:ferredoxin
MATDEFISHTLTSEDIRLIRSKNELSDRKKLFFTALKRVEKPNEFHVIDANELSYTSLKLIDSDACTACQMCYRICPTKALRSDNRNSKIDFDSYLCINCNSCIDVCEVDAINSSPSFNIKDFFEPSIKRLITFDVKKCENCGNFFTAIGGIKSCKRCMIEDDHARDLWGLN